MRSILNFFGVLVFLSGCAGGPLSSVGAFLPTEHDRKLAQAKACCSSHRELPFSKLALGQEASIVLSPDPPVFEFFGGRSFFTAFELPANSQAMVVKTYPVNMLLNSKGHVLVPAVQFLDRGHELIGTVTPQYIARRPRVIGNSWGEAEVLIPASARHFILLDGKSSSELAFRDTDKRSGLLFLRSGPTGEVSVLVRGG